MCGVAKNIVEIQNERIYVQLTHHTPTSIPVNRSGHLAPILGDSDLQSGQFTTSERPPDPRNLLLADISSFGLLMFGTSGSGYLGLGSNSKQSG